MSSYVEGHGYSLPTLSACHSVSFCPQSLSGNKSVYHWCLAPANESLFVFHLAEATGGRECGVGLEGGAIMFVWGERDSWKWRQLQAKKQMIRSHMFQVGVVLFCYVTLRFDHIHYCSAPFVPSKDEEPKLFCFFFIFAAIEHSLSYYLPILPKRMAETFLMAPLLSSKHVWNRKPKGVFQVWFHSQVPWRGLLLLQ